MPLWLWVGLRMSLLAVGSVVLITGCMYIYYWFRDYLVQESMTAADRAEFAYLLEDVPNHHAQLWDILEKYYDINDFLPGMYDNSDWWALFTFVAMVSPLAVALGLWVSKPLANQFTIFAHAARRVAEGDLSARVAERKHQPKEMQLLCADFSQMVERLERYDQEVRESSSNLAHELRTPLNAALGRIQGIFDDVFPMNEAQLLMVQSQLFNLNALVGDLHFLSLAQAGRLRIDSTRFSLSELVEERLAWFSPQFQKAHVDVKKCLQDDAVIYADRSRLGQLINILTENAIRYGCDGKELEVAVYREDDGVVMEFRDRGQAVDERDLRNMFTRFWRAEQSRARIHGGGGLGLSIAKAICDAHGGHIDADRRKEGGLVLRVSLPVQSLPRKSESQA
ncbi:sensor histidine kinase [Pseudomonas atacamensis]|uniref:sensor histidine kinase n=1 Tax=Pseudomonas atacamensis TaxID=2565368 RepID=UPI002447B5D6|nr:ATP-binding protein [Pseudomonas atacamensis]MDH2076833.1 ATP-binding protein [Pseudomonas atacamensis]